MSVFLLLCLALATTTTVSGFKAFGFGVKSRMTALNAGALKPMFDGTIKAPGEHPDQFVLEHENGARAILHVRLQCALIH